MPYSDGTFTSAVQDGPKRVFYPFLNAPTKDTTTKGTVRNYVVLPESFSPASALSTDPDDATQYLIEETALAVEAGVGRFSRTYCKVPTDQIIYGSRVITKPNPESYGTSQGPVVDYTAVPSFFNGVAYSYSSAYFAVNGVYPVTSCSSSVTNPTGGTYTLSYKTSTTAALNYNESAANIAAALNGLADVITDGLTFTCTGTLDTGSISLTITVGGTTTTIVPNGALLTAAASSSLFALRSSSTAQTVRVGRRATITSHGFDSAENLFLRLPLGSCSLLPASLWDSVDANTIAVYENQAFTSASQLLRAYMPGTDRVRVKDTQKFYLPGVTVGITTAEDIPLPGLLLNDTLFLDAVATGASGFTDYDATELTQWRDGPIYTQTIQQIDLDSA